MVISTKFQLQLKILPFFTKKQIIKIAFRYYQTKKKRYPQFDFKENTIKIYLKNFTIIITIELAKKFFPP